MRGLVGQHRLAADVADRVDVRHVGLHLQVGLDEAAVGRRRRPPPRRRSPCRSGWRPTATRIRSKTSVWSPNLTVRPSSCASTRLDAGLEVDRLVAALDALLEHADQVLVGARDQLVEQLDDGDLGAERVVDRRHLEADDAAADDQQPLRDAVDLERAGGVDDPVVLGQERQRRRLRARRDDAVLEADDGVADLRSCSGAVNSPVPRTTWTLRCLASDSRPPVRRPTTLSFHARTLSMSIVGASKLMPASPSSAASVRTLATCSSAFDGMQPTFRQTPPSCSPRSIRATVSPRSAARNAAV